MKKVWDKYYFAFEIDKFLEDSANSCSFCMAIKRLPKELIQQSTSDLPNSVGKVFSADVIRRDKQKINFVTNGHFFLV